MLFLWMFTNNKINVMMKKNVLGGLLLVVMLIGSVSCSDDIDVDLRDVVKLNVANEDNGKTLFGNSDVYINKANNFKTDTFLIAPLGKTKGIGSVIYPQAMEGMVHETEVIPNHLYQVFDEDDVMGFPSGEWAVAVDAVYYQMYVESLITEGDKTTGAKVQYIPVTPYSYSLSYNGYPITRFSSSIRVVEIGFQRDAEFFYYDDILEVFDVTIINGSIILRLKEDPTEENGFRGNYAIYVRQGYVYTKKIVTVE